MATNKANGSVAAKAIEFDKAAKAAKAASIPTLEDIILKVLAEQPDAKLLAEQAEAERERAEAERERAERAEAELAGRSGNDKFDRISKLLTVVGEGVQLFANLHGAVTNASSVNRKQQIEELELELSKLKLEREIAKLRYNLVEKD